MARYAPGNRLAAKPGWKWTDGEIRAYHARIQPIIEEIGIERLAVLMGYTVPYIRFMAGYYQTIRQPSERFVQRFERARFLYHIRIIVVPWLAERAGKFGPLPATWSRARVRAAQPTQRPARKTRAGQ